jgi:hypothetical protein
MLHCKIFLAQIYSKLYIKNKRIKELNHKPGEMKNELNGCSKIHTDAAVLAGPGKIFAFFYNIAHHFRGTLESNYVSAGIDSNLQKASLGHNQEEGLDNHYIKPGKEDLQKAMDKYTS